MQHVGCDWIIDSSATEDRCGVCFGDGSTCETIKEQFNETKIQGQTFTIYIKIVSGLYEIKMFLEAFTP